MSKKSKETTLKASEILYQVVKAQHGIFTARQAIQAGYDERNHPYHVKSGNWIKERRGIYRLKKFPYFPYSELSLWSLWSCNKKGEIQGIYSHETALQIYILSDLLPSKLHMTVPKNFRRGTQVPDILLLYKDTLEYSEWQTVSSFHVTTPTRTLYDVISARNTSERIIAQIIREGLSRDLFSTKELEQYDLLELVNKFKRKIDTDK